MTAFLDAGGDVRSTSNPIVETKILAIRKLYGLKTIYLHSLKSDQIVLTLPNQFLRG